MMEVPLFERIIEQVAPVTKLVCLHLMGDPLLHPELKRLVEICDEYGLKIFFVTNGVLLREKEAEILLHPAFRQINFSLHSFADNFGSKDSTSYLEKIFHFTEMAFERRPYLFINYRLWNLNDPAGRVPDRMADNRDMLRRIEERFSFKFGGTVDTRVKKSYPVKNRLSLHFDTEFIWPALDLPVLGTEGTCHGLSAHFGILVDGTVVPCCLDKEAGIPLGNLKEFPLGDILGGPRAQSVLQGFRDQKLIEPLCQRCQYIERFEKVR